MGYMVRLGLWGDGTSFLNFKDFLGWYSHFKLFFISLNYYGLTVHSFCVISLPANIYDTF